MNYSFNVVKLIKDYLAMFNKPRIKAYVEALLYPVIAIHQSFLDFRLRMLKEVTVTSEVNRLRMALRDRYNNQMIQIIHPGDYLIKAFIFLRTEPRPQRFDYLRSENHLPVVYDYLRSEFDASVDFVVRIPAGIDALEVYNYVFRYKMASIKFKVEII